MDPYLKIGPTTFDVSIVKGLEHEGVKLLGYIDERTGTVTLEEEQCEQSLFNTVWHELIHIVLQRVGTDLNLDRHQEEALTNYLAYAITGLLADNPQLGDSYELIHLLNVR